MIGNLKWGKLENGANPANANVSKDDVKASLQLWTERKMRVLYSLANCAIQQKDIEIATRTLDDVFELETSSENKANVRSIQGRMFLQIGTPLLR